MIDSVISQDLNQQQKRKKLRNSIGDQIPEAIDFNFCTVSETSSREFMLENKKTSVVSFSTESTCFKIVPSKGQLQPRQQVKIVVQYTPDEAKVVVASAVFTIEGEQEKVLKLSAIGKIPYLTINRKKIEFGSLLVGKRVTEDVLIKNESQVDACFHITKRVEDGYSDSSFVIDVKEGRIPAKSTFLIKVQYWPQVVNFTSVNHFDIKCQGGNECQLQVSGVGQSFSVSLSEESINFGDIKFGNTASRLVQLRNDSDHPTKFQFQTACSGNVFALSTQSGVVGARSSARIILHFHPRTTVNYYQRVFCIVRNHCLLYIDLMGSAYDLLTKPIPVNQKHIDLFRNRVIQGRISKLDIKYLENSMINYNNPQHSLDPLEYNQLQLSNNHSRVTEPDNLQPPPVDFQNQLALHQEMFQLHKSPNRIVYLSEDFLDFGFCLMNSTSHSRIIEIHNNLPCEMTILWTLQENVDKTSCFKVFPPSGSLKPLSSSKFEITFSPQKNSQYFYQEVEYFAIKHISSNQLRRLEEAKQQLLSQSQVAVPGTHKSSLRKTQQLQQLSQVCPEELIPSFQGNVRCIGHSFEQGFQTFIPIVELAPSTTVSFQPCSPNQVVYQTIELINKTDTPTYFHFLPDVQKVFKVHPQQGIVQGKQFQILTLEFKPKELKFYNSQLVCNLNHSASNKLTINCTAVCSAPHLKIENQGKIYFPPAYAGLYSTQKVALQNTSRVPVEVKINILQKYQQEVHINPKRMVLKPYESNNIEIAFIPLQKKKYKIQIPIQIFNIVDLTQQRMGYYQPGSGSEIQLQKYNDENEKIMKTVCQEYNMVIMGQGSDGALKMWPQLIDFDIVKVNFNKKVYVTLENNSDCTFWVELQVKSKQKGSSQKLVEECFQLDFQQGVIAAHSKVDIGITFAPVQVVDVELDLECWAKERPMKGVFGMTQMLKKLVVQKCKVSIQGKGSYPNLKIVDVRNDSVSVATLWENFCINQINSNLAQNLDADEKQFLQIETLNFAKAQQLMKRLQAYQWNFGFLPLKQTTKARKIVITIQNVGGTELDWNFKLPSDSQIEVEPWADPGEPSYEEAVEKMIIDRKIFEIKPRSGHLEPGALADIELIYSPTNFTGEQGKAESEEHFLQVILQIVNGKPLLIHLQGMTLAPNKGMIALKRNKYQLPDTPIGQLLPVSFPIEMSNVGCINVKYVVEILELLEDGSKVQSQFNIFDIKNYQGVINQGEKSYLFCLFKPLEQKNYNFEVTINVFNNELKIQEMTVKVDGLGYFMNPPKTISNQVQEIPSARSLVSPIGSKVFFSIEEIDFGELEYGKSEHRIILLYNLSTTNKFNFKFNQLALMCMDNFKVEPLHGTVEPKEFIEIKLTLSADIVPSVYEGEIECMIQWEAVPQQHSNNDTSVQNVFEQKQLLEKETLFLRIKKKSKLQNIGASLPHELSKGDFQDNENNMEVLIRQAITDIINDPEIDNILERVGHQPVQLFSQFDSQPAVDITRVQQPNLEQDFTIVPQLNYKEDYNHLFVNNEFTELVDNIMENTFYNIIQETTRKEADLLKISKTYLTPNK